MWWSGCSGAAGCRRVSLRLCAGPAAVRARLAPYLLDLDPLGCGLAVILGVDHLDGLTWDQVRAGAGRIPARSLQSTIGQVDGIRLLGWADEVHTSLQPGIACAVVDAARLSTPVTVVDLGRATAGFQREVLGRCDRVLMVVPADVRSVRAARRMVNRLELPVCEVVVRGPNPGTGQPGTSARPWAARARRCGRRPQPGPATGTRGAAGHRRRTPLARAGDGILKDVLA